MMSSNSTKHFKAPQSSKKWKQLFFDACQSGNLALVQKLCSSELKAIADIHADDEEGFHLACMNRRLEIVKFLTTSEELLKSGHTFVNIHGRDEAGFRWACFQGHFEIVKFLTTSKKLLKAGHTFVDIHMKDDSGFQTACRNGHFEVVKFLTTSLELLDAGHTFVDIHAQDEEGFRWACANNHWNVVQFLIFELKIERTQTLNAIIKDYPQAQEFFKVREEQERLQKIMDSNQSFQNSLLRLAVILNQTEGRHTSTPLKENDLNTPERKSSISTIRRL